MNVDDVRRFREQLAVRLGLHFDDSKLSDLAELLAARLRHSGLACEAYLGSLHAVELPREEVRALAGELTVGETYFFRNPDQFRAFSEVALPDRVRVRTPSRQVRILSAGCASGEEPYSIAILLAERAELSWTASIRAVDLNAAALAKATQACYSAWALRETPPEVRRRWFRQQGHDFLLDQDLRRFVAFEERNLAAEDPALWPTDGYDIVFCRNVLMYFSQANARALVERIERALAPGGYLFLGHAETLRGLSQSFHLLHTHGTFYYQRRDAAVLSAGSAAREPPQGAWACDPLPLVHALEGSVSWVDAIRHASDRIQMLAHGSNGAGTPSPAPGSEARAQQWDLGSAMELLRAERYGEALDAMRQLPPEAAAAPEVLLLRATLLTHDGQFAQAERACEELLRVDEFNAGAHYLMALCREGLDDREGARHHDRLAAYLDPAFAMPRLHLGLLVGRDGDRAAAGQELAAALDLLRREDGSRMLLFGGGFSREALAALCRSQLAACERPT